jgi:hypothetical protein
MDLNKLHDFMAHELGWNDHNMRRDRPYNGQMHTSTGERGREEVKGLTMRDIRDCYMRAFVMSHEYYKRGSIERQEPNATLIDEANKGEAAVLCENDLFELVGDADPVAVAQNLGCEIERAMGIFPNVPKLRTTKPEQADTGEKKHG